MHFNSELWDFLNVYKSLHIIDIEIKCHLFSDFDARLYTHYESIYRIYGTRGTQSELSGAEY